MQCALCGQELDPAATGCPHCAAQNAPPPVTTAMPAPPTPLVTPISAIPQASPNDGKATAALVLGIIGMIMWCLPILGLPIGIVGIVLGAKGLDSSKRGMAMAGLIMSILCVAFALVNAGIGAYMGATGQHPLFPRPQ